MATEVKKDLAPNQIEELLNTLKTRFEKSQSRHENIEWQQVQAKLEANPQKLWSLYKMEETGGEPDLAGYDSSSNEFIFFDCSEESPKGRRSCCYDQNALETRKEHKPKNSAAGMAAEIGIEILTEEQYRELQKLGKFDSKTSSWLKTPADIRKLGGGIFGDFRFNTVFIYHNGVESYYAGRGFRGVLRV